MPTIPAPKPRWRRVLSTIFLYDILIAVAALANALLSIKRGSSALIAAALILMALAVTKAIIQWRQKDTKDSPHELEGCLYTLYDILVPAGQADPDLRITVHVPRGDGRYLVQALGYVGSQRKKATTGRLTPISCGITGKAYRLKETVRFHRSGTSTEEYIHELVENQGFTEDQARNVDLSTTSGYAVPLYFADGSEAGVVYADAVEPNFFSDDRVNIIDAACVGIARFIQRKYAV